MRLSDFDLYQDLLRHKSGLCLDPDDSYLLDSRLTPVAQKWGYPSLGALTITLRGVPEPALIQDIVEAMTMRETAFFCDSETFEYLRDSVLPYMLKKRPRSEPLRLWSAGCSTGQEAYSLVIAALESGCADWKAKILATDISGPLLIEGDSGRYSQVDMQRGVPVKLMLKYGAQDGRYWQLHEMLRNMIYFQQFNLLHDMEPLGEFDVVLCRHVFPYMEEQTREDVITHLSECLPPDGFLIVGEDETLPEDSPFRPFEDAPWIYVLKNGAFKQDSLQKLSS
ncbi:MAG: protein-glutamate O-methyltransferase CheR [Rhodospirillales bacterium]|nr:protein-glutamate O-methyltransferase CheR [Rhodospirillales bacterium]